MPQQLLLEGPDPEALLLRARSEYGAGVTVVRAEKVRTGGFLGFFAREHYELTVEVPDAEPGQPRAISTPRIDAIDPALAAEIADAQAARAEMFGALPAAAPAEPAAPSAAPAAMPAVSPRVGADHSVVEAQNPLVGADHSFARALQESTAAHDTAAHDTAARDTAAQDAARAQAVAEAAAARAEFVAETAPAEQAAQAAGTIETAAPAAPESTDMAEFDRLVLQLTETADVPARGRSITRASFPVATRTAPRGGSAGGGTGSGASGPSPEGMGADGDDAAAQERAKTLDDPRAATRDGDLVLNRWGVFTDVAAAVATKCTVPALLALGVPRRLTRDFEDLNEPVPLLDVVSRFGVPAVRRPEPGDLVVIAGPAEQAMAVASQVAGWLGMPPTAVALAGEIAAIRGHGRRIRTEAEAAAARRRADKAAAVGEPLIVAVGVAPGRRGAAAAAPLVAAFEADTTWAVVDATKRAAVTAPGLTLLAQGGRIDAIAAIGLADAQAPAAVLDSPLPIAWMDGLPAASVVWAALLGERIADDA